MSNHTTQTQQNNRTAAAAQPTIGERHREAYTQRQRPARLGLWAKVRPILVGGLAGLALGGAVVGIVAYQTMPIEATPIARMFADVNGDGAADFIVSGWVVYGPKSAGQ